MHDCSDSKRAVVVNLKYQTRSQHLPERGQSVGQIGFVTWTQSISLYKIYMNSERAADKGLTKLESQSFSSISVKC